MTELNGPVERPLYQRISPWALSSGATLLIAGLILRRRVDPPTRLIQACRWTGAPLALAGLIGLFLRRWAAHPTGEGVEIAREAPPPIQELRGDLLLLRLIEMSARNREAGAAGTIPWEGVEGIEFCSLRLGPEQLNHFAPHEQAWLLGQFPAQQRERVAMERVDLWAEQGAIHGLWDDPIVQQVIHSYVKRGRYTPVTEAILALPEARQSDAFLQVFDHILDRFPSYWRHFPLPEGLLQSVCARLNETPEGRAQLRQWYEADGGVRLRNTIARLIGEQPLEGQDLLDQIVNPMGNRELMRQLTQADFNSLPLTPESITRISQTELDLPTLIGRLSAEDQVRAWTSYAEAYYSGLLGSEDIEHDIPWEQIPAESLGQIRHLPAATWIYAISRREHASPEDRLEAYLEVVRHFGGFPRQMRPCERAACDEAVNLIYDHLQASEEGQQELMQWIDAVHEGLVDDLSETTEVEIARDYYQKLPDEAFDALLRTMMEERGEEDLSGPVTTQLTRAFRRGALTPARIAGVLRVCQEIDYRPSRRELARELCEAPSLLEHLSARELMPFYLRMRQVPSNLRAWVDTLLAPSGAGGDASSSSAAATASDHLATPYNLGMFEINNLKAVVKNLAQIPEELEQLLEDRLCPVSAQVYVEENGTIRLCKERQSGPKWSNGKWMVYNARHSEGLSLARQVSQHFGRRYGRLIVEMRLARTILGKRPEPAKHTLGRLDTVAKLLEAMRSATGGDLYICHKTFWRHIDQIIFDPAYPAWYEANPEAVEALKTTLCHPALYGELRAEFVTWNRNFYLNN